MVNMGLEGHKPLSFWNAARLLLLNLSLAHTEANGFVRTIQYFSLQIFATFLQPTPQLFYKSPKNILWTPTLNPQPSYGPRFGECKYDLQKSCFYQEKKYLIVLQENSKQRTKDLWENSKQSIAGSTPLYCFDSEKLEIVL